VLYPFVFIVAAYAALAVRIQGVAGNKKGEFEVEAQFLSK
jgi:hypothetical protein